MTPTPESTEKEGVEGPLADQLRALWAEQLRLESRNYWSAEQTRHQIRVLLVAHMDDICAALESHATLVARVAELERDCSAQDEALRALLERNDIIGAERDTLRTQLAHAQAEIESEAAEGDRMLNERDEEIATLTAQNAALRKWLRDVSGADAGDSEEVIAARHEEHLNAVAQNAELREALERAKADTARLDWLDKQDPEEIAAGDNGMKWAIGSGPFWESDWIRDAIDGCMQDDAEARAALAGRKVESE